MVSQLTFIVESKIVRNCLFWASSPFGSPNPTFHRLVSFGLPFKLITRAQPKDAQRGLAKVDVFSCGWGCYMILLLLVASGKQPTGESSACKMWWLETSSAFSMCLSASAMPHTYIYIYTCSGSHFMKKEGKVVHGGGYLGHEVIRVHSVSLQDWRAFRREEAGGALQLKNWVARLGFRCVDKGFFLGLVFEGSPKGNRGSNPFWGPSKQPTWNDFDERTTHACLFSPPFRESMSGSESSPKALLSVLKCPEVSLSSRGFAGSRFKVLTSLD